MEARHACVVNFATLTVGSLGGLHGSGSALFSSRVGVSSTVASRMTRTSRRSAKQASLPGVRLRVRFLSVLDGGLRMRVYADFMRESQQRAFLERGSSAISICTESWFLAYC